MKYKAVCFDMDGVLVNSEPTHYEAFKSILLRHGFSFTHNDYVTYFAGKTDKKGFEDFSTQLGISLPVQHLMDEKSQAYEQLISSIIPYPSTIGFIRELPSAVPIALVTGSSRLEATGILQNLHLFDAFRIVVAAEDVQHGKPEPEGFLKAAHMLGISPSDCIVIEDSPSGVLAGKRAGMYTIALTTTHAKESLTLADEVIDTLRCVQLL